MPQRPGIWRSGYCGICNTAQNTPANVQIEKAATAQQWLEDQLARQGEKPKNVKPIISSADILKRKEEVQYVCGPIMSRPKPRPKVESTPASGTQTPKQDEQPKKKEEEAQPEATVEEMDVD
jgi:heat shock protein 4